MGIEQLNTAMTAKGWGKTQPPAPVKTAMASLESAHNGAQWKSVAAEAGKAKTAAEIKAAKDKIAAAQSEIDKASKAAGDLQTAAGKAASDKDKDIAKAGSAAAAAAKTFLAEAKGYFADALKTLETAEKTAAAAAKTAAKPAGKDAAPPLSKEEEAMLMKFSKRAIQSAIKPKPNAKPMQFAIIGKPGPAIKVLMGTKTEIAKLIGKFGKVDPTTKKKPFIAKDPASELVWENGALIFVSGRIPANYVGSVKKALVRQIKKSPKVKWRKPGAADVDDGDDNNATLSEADLKDADDAKAGSAEQTKAKSEYDKLMQRVKKALPQLAKLSDDDKQDVADALKEADNAAKDEDWVEALSVIEGVEAMLDSSPVDQTPGEDEDQAAPVKAGAGAAAKKAAPDPSAKVREKYAAAEQAWNVATRSAGSEVKTLTEKIRGMFPAGTQNLTEALGTMDTVTNVMSGTAVSEALRKVVEASDDKARVKAVATARATIDGLRKVIERHPVVKELDNNEVHKISAAAIITRGLKQLDSALK